MPDENFRRDVLLRVLCCPARMADLSEAEWDTLLPRARACRCLGRLAVAAHPPASDRLPTRVREHLAAVNVEATHGERSIRWELNRIERALRHLRVPVLLLKGAAYVAAELPVAKARLASDVDIMVPRQALLEVEDALKAAGWRPAKLDPYDQRYYRTWMHELPPLRHSERGTFVDVHHNILPPTARLKPDAQELWRRARPLRSGGFHVLAPVDMILHSAAHLFHDGALARSVRDLVDIRDLLDYFGAADDFWQDLVPRATALDLGRPLFYAIRYCRRLLDLDVPGAVMAAVQPFSPTGPILDVMDRLVPRALVPPEVQGTAGRAAILLLYMRSHWLRMPPGLLVPHMTRRAFARLGLPAPRRTAV